MRTLIFVMIVAGSALMVYNILRYWKFIKRSDELDHEGTIKSTLIIPLLLLIFFLIGYVVVGLSGLATLMMAGILLGGSIFVHLLLSVMYRIIGNMQENDEVLAARYAEMEAELESMTRDSLTVFRVNLTRDEIEFRDGPYLYDTDREARSFSQLVESRRQYDLDEDDGFVRDKFSREHLLQWYQEGKQEISDVTMIRRNDGVLTFVRLEASLRKKPVSGDVMAFLLERPYNEQVVRDSLLEDVLRSQYDRIAYVIEGNLRFLISNHEHRDIFLLPKEDDDETYESLYLNYILPALSRDREKDAGQPNPLRLSVIEKALKENPIYEVNAPFEIGGETRWKHFIFYRINPKARFFLMLLTDSTALQDEQTRRNKVLSEALEQAVRANEARVRFFSNVSHDLRTPMNGILGFMSLARGESDPVKVREYLEKADASGREFIALLEDLFTMSLLDSGTLKLDLAAADLRRMAEELRARYSGLRPEKRLTLRVDTEELVQPAALCDRERLEQILSRLLDNSYAFSPEGETVSLTIGQEPEGYVFRIRNAGCSVPPEILDHIFEADSWVRDDDDVVPTMPGAGMGMALIKGFLDLMNGTAKLDCEMGKYTEFILHIPLSPVREASEEAPEETPEPEAPPLDRALRLLLVDDNEINREIGELMLTGAGCTVDLAENGREAVEKVSASAPGTYDAVLMDVQMPVLNGYEATAEIRKLPDPALAAIPIIALTANAYQEDAGAALAAGMNGYTTKPIDLDKLSAVIRQVLPKGAPAADEP